MRTMKTQTHTTIRAVLSVTLAALGWLATQISLAAAEPATAPGEPMQNVLRPPDAVTAVLDGGETPLRAQDKGRWTHEDIVVETLVEGDRVTVRLAAPKLAVKRIGSSVEGHPRSLRQAHVRRLGARLRRPGMEGARLRKRVMPWYFLYHHQQRTGAAGVMTGPGAMCFWKASGNTIELHADVRSGGNGVMLGAKTLNVCTVVQRHGQADQSAFSVLREFCRQMCPKPRLPAQPVYGFNNWYYDGGINAERFVEDAKFVSRLSPDKDNRPYAVVDDGWQAGPGVWTKGNGKYPSMKDMADEIHKAGARPGLWTRLLQAPGSAPKEWRIIRDPSVAPKYIGNNVLDPTVPEVRKHVADQVKCIRQWGYELIKDDYSTTRSLVKWGSKMGEQLTKEGWSLADRSVTTAEALREHYRNIRDAAGDGAVIIGCNTIGHLAAGIYEVSRIGDDTSGGIGGRPAGRASTLWPSVWLSKYLLCRRSRLRWREGQPQTALGKESPVAGPDRPKRGVAVHFREAGSRQRRPGEGTYRGPPEGGQAAGNWRTPRLDGETPPEQVASGRQAR